jgi:glutathione synthase/RimK-type ligase-like ATP-grasp enzyme
VEASRILIVTDVLDAHADWLIALIREYGDEPVRLNSTDVSAHTVMRLTLRDRDWAGEVEILSNGRTIRLDEVVSVWWRKPNTFGQTVGLPEQQRDFAIEETGHAVRGMLSSLDCYWMSHPDVIRRAGYKIEQLRRAARLGFEVPRTIVTTDPQLVKEFHGECGGQVVYKVLTDPYLSAGLREHDKFVPTTLLTSLDTVDSVRAVPCQFQEYIPKRSEFRVTVIGNDLFTAEILSQEHPETVVDCRRFDIPVTYREARLPDEIAERCLRLTHSYGLNFGAIDLVHTPDGRYVFLEINPNGQFLFVQQRVPRLRMAEALASCLIRGGNG